MTKTAKEIVAIYLKNNRNREIPSFEIDMKLPEFGKTMFGIMFSPATYSRKFRELREEGTETRGFSLMESTKANGVKYFTVGA